ncbi:MAG: kinase-like domain-containing protein [Monoraphidium minutum]|nr:MAG: kinase-like domain-containing protein [Monoraphidium minutum]
MACCPPRRQRRAAMRQSKSTSSFAGLLTSKSRQQLAAAADAAAVREAGRAWPTRKEDYDLIADCGAGVSATVYLARVKAFDALVAIKEMNLEALATPLEDIMREVAVMRAYSCPAILPLHTSFVAGHTLWMVMPYMEGGSVAHIMRYRFKDGLDEAVIASVMREVLAALHYIHRHSGIHRDVKAGNVLVDGEGHVKLGDFGVSATMERGGEWGGSGFVSRNTFVGTPCWMAPEVLEQTQGYGPAADIWSFGITLLEMAHGHAPFAKFPPMKVLLMTLQGPPPQLEAQCGRRHFSKAMREVVALCLNKDPAQRPTAAALLNNRRASRRARRAPRARPRRAVPPSSLRAGFFRHHAKDAAYVKRHLLENLPPLPQRVSEIRRGASAAATQALENDRRAAASQARALSAFLRPGRGQAVLYMNDVAQWDFNCILPPAEGPEGKGPVSFQAHDICSRISTPPPGTGAASTSTSPLPAAGGDAAAAAAATPAAAGAVGADAAAPRAPAAAAAAAAGSSTDASRDASPARPRDAAGGGPPPPAAAPPAPAAALGSGPPSRAGTPQPRRLGRFTLVEGSEPFVGPELSADGGPPPPPAGAAAPPPPRRSGEQQQQRAGEGEQLAPRPAGDAGAAGGSGSGSPGTPKSARSPVARTRSISSPNLRSGGGRLGAAAAGGGVPPEPRRCSLEPPPPPLELPRAAAHGGQPQQQQQQQQQQAPPQKEVPSHPLLADDARAPDAPGAPPAAPASPAAAAAAPPPSAGKPPLGPRQAAAPKRVSLDGTPSAPGARDQQQPAPPPPAAAAAAAATPAAPDDAGAGAAAAAAQEQRAGDQGDIQRQASLHKGRFRIVTG